MVSSNNIGIIIIPYYPYSEKKSNTQIFVITVLIPRSTGRFYLTIYNKNMTKTKKLQQSVDDHWEIKEIPKRNKQINTDLGGQLTAQSSQRTD